MIGLKLKTKVTGLLFLTVVVFTVTVLSACNDQRKQSTKNQTTMKDIASVRGIDHIGITVPDVDAACTFLEHALGATPVYDVLKPSDPPFTGPQTEKELGIPPKSRIIHMRLMRIGNGPSLEIFQFADTHQRKSAGLNDFGYTHIAVYVDDIDAAVKRFTTAGGEMFSAPHDLAGIEEGPHNRGAYGKAPWGSLIEFITYPDGIKYPDTAKTRWTPTR
jgi:catechol 2,3-dioxygenase-like lactoylglutathione lyase family enzyme